MDLKETSNLTVPLSEFYKSSIQRGFNHNKIEKANGEKEYQGVIFYHKGKILFLKGSDDAEWGSDKLQVPGGEILPGQYENASIVDTVYEDIHVDVSYGLMRGMKIDNCQYFFYICPSDKDPIISINNSTHKNYVYLSPVAIQAMSEDNFVEGLKSHLIKVLGLYDPKEE